MVAQLDKTYLRHRPGKIWARLVAYLLFEGRPLTTRGQFINPILQQLHRLLAQLPQLRAVEKPIFIIGTGRSGTTILGTLLSTHRDIGFLNEPKILWHAGFADEDLIGSYTRNRPKVRMNRDDAAEPSRRLMHRLHGGFLRFAGARRLVDKYPELVFRTGCVQAVYPDARFVFISRDGEDTIASIEAWSNRLGTSQGGERHDWWGANDRKWHAIVEDLVCEMPVLAKRAMELRATSDHKLRAAVEWLLAMREGLALMQQLPPEQFLHVRYETLCADPEEVIGSILRFADLPSDPKCLAYAHAVLKDAPIGAAEVLPAWLAPAFEDTQAQLDQLDQLEQAQGRRA